MWVPRGGGTREAGDSARAIPGRALVERVLVARGLHGDEDYLHPSLMHLHDPSLIPDLDRACERILRACRDGEPVAIYGDYDVDGTSACAILFHTLRAIAPGADVRTYLPSRMDEGYGIHTDALARLAGEGVRVVVSVDCGITARAEARAARGLGIDLIISDHHTPPESVADLPEAFAVVHPRRPDSAYPFGDLCGAGVAYKIAWRLCTLHRGSDRIGDDLRALLVDLLALGALGTIADVVPLLGENRVIARFGLRRIRSSPIEGLRALVEASRLDGEGVSEEDVGFRLAPRLNACGRLGHAGETLELLTTARGSRAREIARELTRLNDERRRIEHAIFEHALRGACERGMDREESRSVVLHDPSWHPGVVGIACSRVVERLCRPTLLLCEEGETLRGSGRSVPGFDLHAALVECADLLDRFGGHSHACGLSLRRDRFDAFSERFASIARAALASREAIPTIEYDATIDESDLSLASMRGLLDLAPFGAGNPRPRLVMRGVMLTRDAETFGSSGDHVSLRVMGSEGEARVVAWRSREACAGLKRGQRLDLVIEPAISTWNGRSRVEPRLEDLRLVGS